MAKKSKPQYQEMSLFDDAFFGIAPSEGELFPTDSSQKSEEAMPTKEKKKSKKQLAFEEMMEKARLEMEEAERTGNVVSISFPVGDDGKADFSGWTLNEDAFDKKTKVNRVDEDKRLRAKKQRLKVTFADDGTVICDVSATVTMIEVIAKIGVKRVASLNMESCHVPLVSQEINPRYAQWTKEIVDGWYLMAQGDTKQKLMQLKSIIAQLEIDVTVEIGDFESFSTSDNARKGNTRKKKTKLEVCFADGTVILSSDPLHTFKDVVEYIGIDKVKRTNLKVADKPIVTASNRYAGQIELSSGEWLTVPPQTKDKYKILRVISSMTHVAFEVKMG